MIENLRFRYFLHKSIKRSILIQRSLNFKMHSNRSGRVGRAKYSERISNLRSKSSSFADDSNANLASLGSGRRVSSSQHEQKAVKRRFVPTPSSWSFFCKTCKVSCSGESSYNAHLKGKIHHRKLVAQQQDVKPNNLKAAVRCDLCSVACCSSRDFEAHVNGQKHQKTLKLMMNVNETISNMEYAATSENTAASLIGTELPPDELDCLVREKVVQIEKNVDDLREVEQLVLRVEETLYAVSEFLDQAVGIVGDAPPPQQKRFLRGIMRVQLMAKQLLLKSDKRVDLVLLCSVVPTTKLLFQIIELLRQIINKNNEQSIYVAEKIAESAIFVSQIGVSVDVYVTLTCSAMRQWSPGNLNYYPYEEPPNALPFGPCLMALTEMRRTKFYQVKCAPHASMRSLVKIMRDIRRRVPAWQVLTDWMIELSVEKVLSAGNNTELGPGAALRALFDAVSSSFILGKGTSLADPCEKLPFDVFAGVSDMARMNIYHSARYAIRQFKINKMDKLLALDGSPGIPSERPPKRKKVAELMAVTTTARNANSTLKNGGSSADAASATSDGRHNNLNKGRWRDEQLSNVIDKKDIKL